MAFPPRLLTLLSFLKVLCTIAGVTVVLMLFLAIAATFADQALPPDLRVRLYTQGVWWAVAGVGVALALLVISRSAAARELRAEVSDLNYWVGWALAVLFLGATWNRGWPRFALIVWVTTFAAWCLWRALVLEKHSPLQVVAIVFSSMLTASALIWRFAGP